MGSFSVENHVLSTLKSLNLSPETSSRSESPPVTSISNGSNGSTFLGFAFQEVPQELVDIQDKFDRWLQNKKEKIIADNLAYKETLRANSGNHHSWLRLRTNSI